MNIKIRHMLFYLERQVRFRKIGRLMTEIVWLAGHALGVAYAVQKTIGNVANMYEISFEVSFKNGDVAVGQGGIYEVVHQKITPHPWRHTEYRRKTKHNSIRRPEQLLLGLRFC